MATGESLNLSMDQAVRRYASLFRMPSYRQALLIISGLCLITGIMSSLALFSMPLGIIIGLLLGASLFCMVFVSDILASKIILAKDPIFDLKRTAGLSIFCWGVWLLFTFAGSIAAQFGTIWWVRLTLLGYSAVLVMRVIVLSSLSTRARSRYLLAAFLEPFSSVIVLVTSWIFVGHEVSVLLLVFLMYAFIVAVGSSEVFMYALNRVGQKMLGIKSMNMLRAFLLNWVVDLNGPFEGLLEQLSEERDIEVSVVKLGSSGVRVVGAVPAVHPGPFKNIGSSVLPAQLKASIETTCGGVAFIPHGLMGHEFDLPSQAQNQKIIDAVIAALNFEESETTASPFVTVKNGSATACCQIFGKSALISFTLAPRTIEDLPLELGEFMRRKAEEYGLLTCVVINAHNSIDGTAPAGEVLESLKKVGADCLERATHSKQTPLEAGSSSVLPREWAIKDGMGAGGITVLIVKAGRQKSAYVTIDGNNMVSGLREKMLEYLRSAGFPQGEIFTTDTHSVSGVILGSKGYHPVGEVMDQELLCRYVIQASKKADSDLKQSTTGCRTIVVPNVRVIGEQKLASLLLLIEKGMERAKKAIVPVLLTTGFLLMLFLFLL